MNVPSFIKKMNFTPLNLAMVDLYNEVDTKTMKCKSTLRTTGSLQWDIVRHYICTRFAYRSQNQDQLNQHRSIY